MLEALLLDHTTIIDQDHALCTKAAPSLLCGTLYWFSVTLSFSVLSLATKSGLKAVFFYLGDQSPRPPGVYRFEAKSEVGKLGGARPPNLASRPRTALGLLPSIALSSDQVSLV
jgi:hypothetical protein